MKIHKITFYALALLSFASCNNDDIVPDTPDVPAEGYHLTFDGGVGVETGTRAVWNDDSGLGNLIFQWDYTKDTGTNEMVMAFMNGGQLLASNNGKYHTYATIKPHSQHSDDAHWAVFETVEKYEHDMPSGQYDGYKVLAVTPYRAENSSTVASSVDAFSATLTMPCQFTQVAEQEPDFLRNYMYMYATSTIAGGSATLAFNHIPATFRFIVINKRSDRAKITSIQVSLADATPVASKSVTITGTGTPTFSSDTYTTITTLLGEGGTDVRGGEKYIAYALALPLADNNAFYGKKIQFTIATDDELANKYRSFVLDGELLKTANDNGVYNWVSGKSYTIRMSLSDILSFDGITVNDWTEKDINGGAAEENSSTDI